MELLTVELFTKLIIVAGALAVAWMALQPRYVFLVRVEQGRPRLARGRVTPQFLHLVGETCASFDVARGWVGGSPRGKQIALHFSRGIPPQCRQRLRNLWAIHR
jgi:hypothetical protein